MTVTDCTTHLMCRIISSLVSLFLSSGKGCGLKVVQVFPEEGNLGLVLPKELSKWTMDKVRKEGIEVHPGNTLETAVVEDGKVKVKLSGGEEVRVCVCVCPHSIIEKNYMYHESV